MRPNDLKKGYYKLYDDAPTKADKAREAGLAKELSKKDKKPVIKATVVKASVKPLSAKQREAGMIEELSKEDFYGKKKEEESKKAPEWFAKKVTEQANDAAMQDRINKALKEYKNKSGLLRRAPNK